MKIFIAILCFISLSDSLLSQERGSFHIRDLIVRLNETDSVEVMFSIELLSNSVTHDGGLLLTPTIINNENKVILASIYAEKQNGRFGRHEIVPHFLTLLKVGVPTNYSTSIPFEEWMNGANMDLDIVRVSRKQSIIFSRMLRNNLALEKKRVVSVDKPETTWHVTEKLQFVFSSKGISKDVIESIVSGDHAVAIEALLEQEGSPNVWNTLGVAYGYSGAYDKAQHCFEMAEKGGFSMATLNINELNNKIITIK